MMSATPKDIEALSTEIVGKLIEISNLRQLEKRLELLATCGAL